MEICENELVARGLKGDHADFIIVLNNTVLASEICLF